MESRAETGHPFSSCTLKAGRDERQAFWACACVRVKVKDVLSRKEGGTCTGKKIEECEDERH